MRPLDAAALRYSAAAKAYRAACAAEHGFYDRGLDLPWHQDPRCTDAWRAAVAEVQSARVELEKAADEFAGAEAEAARC